MSTNNLTDREYSFDKVIARAKAGAGVKSMSALAKKLGMSSGDLSNRKKRGTLPYEKLVAFFLPRSVSIDWLLTGEGPKRRGGAVRELESGSTSDEATLLVAYRSLSPAEQKALLQSAEDKQRLRRLEHAVAELHQALADGDDKT